MNSRFVAVFVVALFFGLGLTPAKSQTKFEPIVVAQATTPAARQKAKKTPAPAPRLSENQIREKINAWVVGVAAGKLEGAPIRLVEEMSRVLDDGDDMQVLPIITRGPSYNVHALLYLRGIDLAVINGDVLDFFGKQQNISGINQRIHYITQLFNSELHILARPEIKSIQDLVGKPVNFNTKGTSAAFTGPILLDRLGIKVKKTFIPHPVAMQQMKKSDKFAAVVFVTAKPVRPLVKKKWPPGFKLLSVPFNQKLTDFYLPATLSAKDYPALIAPGQVLETVAVPTVLAAFNWSRQHHRYRKVARFVDYLFEKFDRLKKDPFHPKWRQVNLAAKIPGWNRLPVVQAKLDKMNAAAAAAAAAAASTAAIPANTQQATPAEVAEQKRLFKEFLQWKSRQQRLGQ